MFYFLQLQGGDTSGVFVDTHVEMGFVYYTCLHKYPSSVFLKVTQQKSKSGDVPKEKKKFLHVTPFVQNTGYYFWEHFW